MKRSSKIYRSFFKKQGQRGGVKRSKQLSATQRQAIAIKAAQARWHPKTEKSELMTSVRLDHPLLEDAVFLGELLLEGTLADWRKIYNKIVEQPYGSVAHSLEKVLSSTQMYGVVPLWKGILSILRGGNR